MPRTAISGYLVTLAALLLAGLAGCADPYKVSPSRQGREAVPPAPQLPGPLGQFDYDPRPHTIALCYSNILNSPEEVMAEAQELCANEGLLQRVHEDVFWNPCALIQPVRVTFICTPGPPESQAYR